MSRVLYQIVDSVFYPKTAFRDFRATKRYDVIVRSNPSAKRTHALVSSLGGRLTETESDHGQGK